jgi:hypothetical protein
MCDNPKCLEIFSESEKGWSTSQQVQMVEDERGQRRTVSVTMDLCPECSGDTTKTAQKLSEAREERRHQRLALTSGKGRTVRPKRRQDDDDEFEDARP